MTLKKKPKKKKKKLGSFIFEKSKTSGTKRSRFLNPIFVIDIISSQSMSQYTQPDLMGRFNTAQQYSGPTMIFETEIAGGNGAKGKQFVNLDDDYGVRTDITGLPDVSRSCAKSYDFNPHQPPRAVDLRHVHESPGGLPFSIDHKDGINRAMSVSQMERNRQFGTGSIGGVASHLISGETAQTLNWDQKQVRAKTPPYTRGTEGRIGQNRYNVTENRPCVGGIGMVQEHGINVHIDKMRINTNLTPKIPLNTVTQSAFRTATETANQEGAQMKEFMRAARPDLMYYNDTTVNGSRERMLNTVSQNDQKYNSTQNAMKKELLSSQLVRSSLEDHHPVQDMLYTHPNNATMRRT